MNLTRILELPSLYRLLGTAVGRPRMWKALVHEYACVQPGQRILEIGCGPGDLLSEAPDDIGYIGFDHNERYINWARQRYGDRAEFFAGNVDLAHIDRLGAGSFDIVIGSGVLHHLDDHEATVFFELARAALRPGGKLVTADGCYQSEQSPFVRMLLDMDRGHYVRTEEEYVALASKSFASHDTFIRNNTLTLSYTLLFMVCRA